MAKTYRRFSTEFKLGVVEAYLAGEGSLKGLATKAGVDHSLVHYWLKKYHAGELSLDLLREEASVEDAQQIAALERKVGQLTMELDLLKRGLIAAPATSSGRSLIISGPADYDVVLRTAPPRDQLSRAQEQVLDEVFDEFGHWYRWDLVEFVHTLREWHDSHGSSIPISVRDLLYGGRLDGEQVDDIEASLLGEDAMASLPDDYARRFVIRIVAGTTFFIRDRRMGPRLFVVLTNVDPENGRVVTAPIVSERRHSENTLRLRPGDHPFIQHASNVDFGSARYANVANLRHGMTLGEVRTDTAVDDTLLQRMQQGYRTHRVPLTESQRMRHN